MRRAPFWVWEMGRENHAWGRVCGATLSKATPLPPCGSTMPYPSTCQATLPEAPFFPRNGLTLGLWNSDTPSINVATNLYGSHPVWFEQLTRADSDSGSGGSGDAGGGGAHGVFLRNSVPVDVDVRAETLSYRATGGTFELYFFAGPSLQQVCKGVGLWMAGLGRGVGAGSGVRKQGGGAVGVVEVPGWERCGEPGAGVCEFGVWTWCVGGNGHAALHFKVCKSYAGFDCVAVVGMGSKSPCHGSHTHTQMSQMSQLFSRVSTVR
eukprot:351694-Chlamydomonas_euryale.AAC.1